jgi:DNA-binding response OmpR family regulator
VKILVADDDGPLRKTIGKILDTAGYEVLLAEDGKSAVTRAAAEKPDLIITDALMPGLHGFLVCKTVKEFSPAPRVIMLTAVYTKPGFKWEARDKYGADDLLTKPFKVPELLSAIETQLAAGMTGEPLGTW